MSPRAFKPDWAGTVQRPLGLAHGRGRQGGLASKGGTGRGALRGPSGRAHHGVRAHDQNGDTRRKKNFKKMCALSVIGLV